MRHGESQGNLNTAAYTTTPDHSIQLTAQGMTQARHAGEQLRRVLREAEEGQIYLGAQAREALRFWKGEGQA